MNAKLVTVAIALGMILLGSLRAGEPQPDQRERLHISLAGVTLHSVVLYISDFTGKPVLLPDRFPGDKKLDIVSGATAGVPASKAMTVFATALRSVGYAMIEREEYIQILPEGEADAIPLAPELPTSGLGPETILTTVVEVKNADASKLVPIISALRSKAGSVHVYQDSNKLVITEHGPILKTMLALVANLDKKWADNVWEVHKLQNTSVEALQSLVQAYVRSLGQGAEPLVAKRLAAFSVYPYPPANAFVLFGHAEDIARVKQFIMALDVKSVSATRTFHTYNVLNRNAADLVQVLTGLFTAARAPGGAEPAAPAPSVIADPINNSIIVICTPEKFAEIKPLIEQLDKPKAQVLIESALVELSLEKLLDLGVELMTTDKPGDHPRGFMGTAHGLSTATEKGRVPLAPPGGGLVAGIFKDNAFKIAALLRASQQNEDVSFIAAPRLMASDNKPARVEIKEQREYQKSIITPEGRTSEVTHGGFLDAGITLDITPHINEEGTVRLEIKQITEQFLPGTTTPTGTLTNKTSRLAQTEVTVPNGQTVVIAGLTRTVQVRTVKKVPLLGNLPLLGFLFRRTETNDQQRNLCVFITPTIMTTPEAQTAEAERRRAEMKALSGAKDGSLPLKTFDEVTGGKEKHPSK